MQPLGVVDRTYLQRLSSEPLTSLHYCMCTEANAVVHVEIAAATYICTPASMHLYVFTCNADEEVHPRTLIATGLIHSPRWHGCSATEASGPDTSPSTTWLPHDG